MKQKNNNKNYSPELTQEFDDVICLHPIDQISYLLLI